MKTPREKYEHDPQYRRLVDTMLALINGAQFTPSEIREAAMYAAILYEDRKPWTAAVSDSGVIEAATRKRSGK